MRVVTILSMVIVGITSLLTASAAASPEERRVSSVESRAAELLNQQDLKGALPAVVGSSKPGVGGIVVAQLLPGPEVVGDLEPGDIYDAPILGATEVGIDGSFTLKLDPQRLPLAVGDNSVYLVHVRSDATPLAASAASITVLPADRSQANRLSPVTVNLESPDREPLSTGQLGHDADAERNEVTVAEEDVPAEQASGGFEQYQHGSCQFRVLEKEQTPVTILVTGTNTSGVSYEVSYERSSSAEIGMGVNFGSGWSPAGSVSIKNSNDESSIWDQFNDYGTYSHRLHHWFIKEEAYNCHLMNPHERVRSIGVGIQMNRDRWDNTAYPTYCEKINGNTTGKYTQSSTRATTWSGGAKTSLIGMGINLSSQSGYSEKTKTVYHATRNDRWICGWYGYPSDPQEGSPGYLMADYKCRGRCMS